MEASSSRTGTTDMKKVMISSTALDLPDHRNQVRDACLRQGMFPLMMEYLPLCLSSHVVPVRELAIIIAMIPASGLEAVTSRKMIIGPEWSKILRG